MDRVPISNKTRFEIFKRDSFTCQYCGGESPQVKLQVDHITPVCKGGDNSPRNLITSCYECNIGKGGRLLNNVLFIETKKKVVKTGDWLSPPKEKTIEEKVSDRVNSLSGKDYEIYCLQIIANNHYSNSSIELSKKLHDLWLSYRMNNLSDSYIKNKFKTEIKEFILTHYHWSTLIMDIENIIDKQIAKYQLDINLNKTDGNYG